MPSNLDEAANNLLGLAERPSNHEQLLAAPIESPAGRRSGQISASNSTTSPGFSDISSLTEVTQRSQATTDPQDVLVDSDDEETPGADEPDDGSIQEVPEFDELLEGCEEAQLDRMLQLCTVGLPEGADKDQSIEDGDKVMKMIDLPAAVKIYRVPEDHKPSSPDLGKGEIPFDQVDNPGNWPDYVYRPKFKKTSGAKYSGHFLPSGAQPVPANADGKRIKNGWEFHYQPWQLELEDGEAKPRSGATPENMFPESRQGCLDAELLKKLGLTARRMQEQDSLFFLQLLFPICDPKRSGVSNDPRTPFYFDVERFTGTYMSSQGYGGSYGHNIKPILAAELVVFHGVLVRDGVKGGSKGALYRLWDTTGSCYDPEVASVMSFTRWKEIRRVIKLNDNARSWPKNSPLYNPAHKYDLVYKAIVNNCNALTKYAELDLCIDEMTWKFMGYGEGGVVYRIVGKPGVTKGGQVAFAVDRSRCRPRAYIHRHKWHNRPQGFGKQGPNEVRMLAELLEAMVIKEEGDGIFTERPHLTFDNFFSGDEIMDYLGCKGFAATCTVRRDRLPSGVPKTAFHHEKEAVNDRNKVARFLEPITAVKKVPQDGENRAYTRVHCSFQSTGATNISTVNAIDCNLLYACLKQRGVGDDLLQWGIEMNPFGCSTCTPTAASILLTRTLQDATSNTVLASTGRVQ